MIIAVVRIPLPEGATLEQATALFEGSAPKYRDLPGLLRKHYIFGGGMGGGVYFWDSREAAMRVYTPEWRAMIRERYGAEP
ncbi:MAG: hypothetical protein HQL39_20815, partial [Alphaproteobacteria bacterium]|nr:hypothetical protein [Alphaproteobacteria bacterium]